MERPVEVPLTLGPDSTVPAYAREGDAGADLVATEAARIPAGGGRATIGTGVAISLPEGYAGFVHPRSGLASRHGITVLNAPGTVDSGYRGELRVTLLNTDPHDDFVVRPGDRIAQLVVQKVETVTWVPVDALSSSSRGADGFGSTGGFSASPSAPNNEAEGPAPTPPPPAPHAKESS